MITVQIACKPVAARVWKHMEMQPSEYFWTDPDDPTQQWDVDSAPKLDLISQLLNSIGSDPLEQAVTTVTNAETRDYRECAYHFWRDHESYVCLVTDKRGDRTEKEVIFAGIIPFGENGSQVVRITLHEAVPLVTMNMFMWGVGGDEHSIDMLRGEEANKTLQSTRETRATER